MIEEVFEGIISSTMVIIRSLVLLLVVRWCHMLYGAVAFA